MKVITVFCRKGQHQLYSEVEDILQFVENREPCPHCGEEFEGNFVLSRVVNFEEVRE